MDEPVLISRDPKRTPTATVLHVAVRILVARNRWMGGCWEQVLADGEWICCAPLSALMVATRTKTLMARDRAPDDYFGNSVVIGNATIVDRVPYLAVVVPTVGKNYFVRSENGELTEQTKLTDSGGENRHEFGSSVCCQ
jgi:hypothetical protein